MADVATGTLAMKELRNLALHIALMQRGRGETEGNNAGPWVSEYRRDSKREAWCAAFCCWCYELAWARLNGFQKWGAVSDEVQDLCPLKRSHGAIRLCKEVNKLVQIAVPEPGDLALWDWGKGKGHVAMVVHFTSKGFTTVDGNKDPEVDVFSHPPGGGSGFVGFFRVD